MTTRSITDVSVEGVQKRKLGQEKGKQSVSEFYISNVYFPASFSAINFLQFKFRSHWGPNTAPADLNSSTNSTFTLEMKI